MQQHEIVWGPISIHLTRGAYAIRLHGAKVKEEPVVDCDGAPFPAAAGLATALWHAEEVASIWGAELPAGLPARAVAIARWF